MKAWRVILVFVVVGCTPEQRLRDVLIGNGAKEWHYTDGGGTHCSFQFAGGGIMYNRSYYSNGTVYVDTQVWELTDSVMTYYTNDRDFIHGTYRHHHPFTIKSLSRDTMICVPPSGTGSVIFTANGYTWRRPSNWTADTLAIPASAR